MYVGQYVKNQPHCHTRKYYLVCSSLLVKNYIKNILRPEKGTEKVKCRNTKTQKYENRKIENLATNIFSIFTFLYFCIYAFLPFSFLGSLLF